MNCPLLILFARAPVAGRVKTRLCPPLSFAQAADLHSALVQDAIEMLSSLSDVADLELSSDSPSQAWPGVTLPRSLQPAGGLDVRLFHALSGALTRGCKVAMVIGSDSPGLPSSHIDALLKSDSDVTLGPTLDGGFFAIACRRVHPNMFEGVRWSTVFTLDDVVRSVVQCNLTITMGPAWFDVDVEEDLQRMLKMSNLPNHTARWSKDYREHTSGSVR
jgi:rSAM/selenodomain-associated transferase 1